MNIVGGIVVGLVVGLGSLIIIIWGILGIVTRELPWQDNSEYSTGASGTLTGCAAVVSGIILVLLGIGGLVAAFVIAI